MPRRLLNLVMLAAILVGGVLAWRSGAERIRLEGRYRRMAHAAGDLSVVNPTKVYFLGLDTDEPLHFAWRMHAPANYPMIFSHAGGGGSGSSTSSSGAPSDAIVRVRCRRDEAGRLQVFSKAFGGSSLFAVEDAMAKFLAGREDELIVERLAADGPVEMDASASAVLLRVAMPASMIAEARVALPGHVVDRHVPDVFKITVGPPQQP
ncbi:MAG: hypothetical protein BGO49_16895 [Planctomycetales bacterium 71-10]|nr:MAG: hypothetical protein BGO49_16895 [Planctomycetales bacterium 71-10]